LSFQTRFKNSDKLFSLALEILALRNSNKGRQIEQPTREAPSQIFKLSKIKLKGAERLGLRVQMDLNFSQ